jgi:hypothetical protein
MTAAREAAADESKGLACVTGQPVGLNRHLHICPPLLVIAHQSIV